MWWMDGKIFVLTILFMVIVVPSVFKLVQQQMRQNAERRAVDDELGRSNAEMLERLGQLEERIRVLERIVTDDRYELERRFRELGG